MIFRWGKGLIPPMFSLLSIFVISVVSPVIWLPLVSRVLTAVPGASPVSSCPGYLAFIPAWCAPLLL